MKILILNIVFVIGLIGSFFYTYNETKGTNKIAYIRSNDVLANYKKFKEAKQIFAKETAQMNSQVDTLTNELKQLMANYDKEVANYSTKEKELSQKLMQAKQQQLYQYQQAVQQKIKQKDTEMTQKLIVEINAFLEDYGKEHSYTMIFGANQSGNIVYGDKPFDITEIVIELLNK